MKDVLSPGEHGCCAGSVFSCLEILVCGRSAGRQALREHFSCAASVLFYWWQ